MEITLEIDQKHLYFIIYERRLLNEFYRYIHVMIAPKLC